MKVYNEFIKRIWPGLGKNELRLCMILLDICKKSDYVIDKADIYKHPLITNTLRQHFSKIAKNITYENDKIICDKYNKEPVKKYTLFHEITIEQFKIHVRIDEKLFSYFKRTGYAEISTSLFEKFDHVYETKFILWFKTWEMKKEQEATIEYLKTLMNKQYKTPEFITTCIKPVIYKLMADGLEIKITRIPNKNDKRVLDSLHFKVVN